MINILLSGCNGRMGNVITDIVSKKDSCKIIAGVDVTSASNKNYPVYSSFAEIPDGTEIDVLIDFSHPSALQNIIDFTRKRKIPSVLSTTGYSEDDICKIKELSNDIAVFRSANMSIGICLLKALVKKAAGFLDEDYDIEIIEKHHNRKLDAPSGTALAIADAVNEDSEYTYVYDRQSVRKARSKKEIGISAVRGGNIVGDHDVLFIGENEILEINHRALSRSVFAEGAVRAAMFVFDKPAGFYDMDRLAESEE